MGINNLTKIYVNISHASNILNLIDDNKCNQIYGNTTERSYISYNLLEKIFGNIQQCNCVLPQFVWAECSKYTLTQSFYESVIKLQKKYFSNSQYENTIELSEIHSLNNDIISFFQKNHFLFRIIISDNLFNPDQKLELYKVEQIVKNLVAKDIHVEIDIVIRNYTINNIEEVYFFLKECRANSMSISPSIDSIASSEEERDKIADDYGKILCELFDLWYDDLQYEKPENNIFIKFFDSMLCQHLNGKHTVCDFREKCGSRIFIDSTGDVYPCNLYTDNQYLLGNLKDNTLEDIYTSQTTTQFYGQKEEIAEKCKKCDWLKFCHCDCIKNRKIDQKVNKCSGSYFCDSYKRFFEYTNDKFCKIAEDMM